MKSPLVSVIVPVYNAELYLKNCLDSILGSTLPDIEIIAVDDGSSDSSWEILSEYQKQNNICTIRQVNGGPSRARNTGLRVAHGEFVGFVDSDDWIEKDMYSKMYDAAKDVGADIVFCNSYRNNTKTENYFPSGVYKKNKIVEHIYPRLISTVDELSRGKTLRGSVVCRIFRREMLKANGILFHDDIHNNEDQLFSIQATLAASCYVYLGDDYLYHNRITANSITRRYIPELWERQQKLITLFRQITEKHSYDFSPQFNKKVFEIACYSIVLDNMPDSPLSFRQKLDRATMIINSEVLRQTLQHLNWKQLKKINKIIFFCFLFRFSTLAIYINKWRNSKRDSKG